jgi:hypothetical protein
MAARSIAVDVDPVLLTIASTTFADTDGVRIVEADLRDPAWVDALPEAQVDAVITATAPHWLSADVVERVYRDLARWSVLAECSPMPNRCRWRSFPASPGDYPKSNPNAGPVSWSTVLAATPGKEEAARDPLLQTAADPRRGNVREQLSNL